MGEAMRQGLANDDEPQLELGGERLRVLLSATVQSGVNAIQARLREVSRTGALVAAAVIPPVGSLVRISRGEVDVAARVVWTGKTSFEVRFREAIDERALFITVGDRRAESRLARCKPLFPDQNHIGLIDADDDWDNSLPFAKH